MGGHGMVMNIQTERNRREGEPFFDNQIVNRYLNTAELASHLGVSEHTVRAWRKFRIITPNVFGRSVRWLLDDVLEELSDRRSKREKS